MVTTAMIKRCLLLGRKAMSKLDSILKSRDITFLTKGLWAAVLLNSRGALFTPAWGEFCSANAVQKSLSKEFPDESEREE